MAGQTATLVAARRHADGGHIAMASLRARIVTARRSTRTLFTYLVERAEAIPGNGGAALRLNRWVAYRVEPVTENSTLNTSCRGDKNSGRLEYVAYPLFPVLY
jgi:hypothetical protein